MRPDHQRRYARQIMLPEIGEAGQQRLLDARVLVIGAGGLGAALITYLAAAGVGHIGIIDDDRVELSNLPRQIIHETGDIGRLKVDSASDRIAELNPEMQVTTYPTQLTQENAAGIIGAYDLIADGCDNFATRFLVNATCMALGKPLVSAAIAGWAGQVMTIAPHLAAGTACYQCLVNPEAREANTCRESGVIGPLAGVIGSMQALEVIRTLLGAPALIGRMAIYDGKTARQRLVATTRDDRCPICAR
ncbi:MAG: HesA/MoeB/ThiF family protein [Pseudomonadota bacterium]